MLVRTTCTDDETRALAREVGHHMTGGDIVLLFGELGAGKTTFVQGLAQGLGIAAPVTSPTFTLIHEYRGPEHTLVHVDPYRLRDEPDLETIGLEDYLEQPVALAVEWGERLGALTPSERLEVTIALNADGCRTVTMAPVGQRWSDLLAGLEAKL